MKLLFGIIFLFVFTNLYGQNTIVVSDSTDIKVVSFLYKEADFKTMLSDSIKIYFNNDSITIYDTLDVKVSDSCEIIDGKTYPPIYEGLLYYSGISTLPKILSVERIDSNSFIAVGYAIEYPFYLKNFVLVEDSDSNELVVKRYVVVSGMENRQQRVEIVSQKNVIINLTENGMHKDLVFEISNGVPVPIKDQIEIAKSHVLNITTKVGQNRTELDTRKILEL